MGSPDLGASNLVYDWAGDSDAEEITALFAVVFARPLSAAYWRWMFFAPPEGGGYAAVARHGGRIVSHCGYSLRQCRVNGADRRAAVKCTSMTDPAYQGQGIYTSLMEWAHHGLKSVDVDLVLSWPNLNNHPSQRNRTDYEDVYQIPTLRRLPSRWPNREDRPITLTKARDLDLRSWGQLATASAGCSHFALTRSAQYCQWRYHQRPETEYYGVEHRESGVLKAAALVKPYPPGRPDRLNIVEWSCHPEDRSGGPVLDAIEECAEAAGLQTMIWHNVHDYPRHHLLERRGYRLAEPVFYFGVFPLAPRECLGNYHDWREWYITMGDVDVF